MAHAFTLIVALLTVESSYVQEVERPVKAVPDTVQFWLAPDSQWRIKTFAIDHDIHVYRIGAAAGVGRLTAEFARNNIKKSYGDVTAEIVALEFANPADPTEVQKVLGERHLGGKLELVKDGYWFYNPDAGIYRTRSAPK